jgi:hypothetical protein
MKGGAIMKKFIALLLISGFAATLIGCNEPEETTITPEGTETIIVEETI